MAYEGRESYYIREDALQMLLAGVGLKGWYGFSRGRHEYTVSREQVNRILVYLYQEGYAAWEENTVKILEPIKTLIQFIAKTEKCIQIDYLKNGEKKLCYFYKNKFAVLEAGTQDFDKLRFCVFDEEEFFEYLKGTGVLQEELEQIEGNEETSEDDITIYVSCSLRNVSTGHEEASIKIGEKGVFSYIYVFENLEMKKVLYSEKIVRESFDAWMKG